jgi:UDP-N-acetylglucosamine 2-epimerase (non-hydrolysing)
MVSAPKKILFIFGTRPEAIKLAPLVKEFQLYPEKFEVSICITAQHREMLDQVLHFFGIQPDFDLNIMKPGQSLFDVSCIALKELEYVLDTCHPQLVFVQGDTTTSFIGALASFYKKIKVVHIEAGLRSTKKYSPFPEEMNRLLTSHLADFHFTPTKKSTANLNAENIHDHIYHVGNTVIDALFLGLNLVKSSGEEKYKNIFSSIDFLKKIVLITGHRRESFGIPFENICHAIKEVADKFPDVEFVYPVHLNPQVQLPVNKILSGSKNIHLIKPLDYPSFIWLMNSSNIILTDSGGLQEEAPSLGKPVLVMRDVTEREEGITAGTAKLVGTNKMEIVNELTILLSNETEYKKMAMAVNPYGDGSASKKIVDIIDRLFSK